MTFFPIKPAYTGYLEDESRTPGKAEGIAFPENTQELSGALRAAKSGRKITVQGSRTNLTGSATPNGGLIINLERMDKILECFDKDGKSYLRVQAGAKLREIEIYAQSVGCFFPPDPTEKNAAAGGLFATGGAGPSSQGYGSSSRYIASLVWVTASGDIWEIERGKYIFDAQGCPMPDGRRLEIAEPKCASPIAHGIPLKGCDLIDFLAGSEGKLGAAAELTLSLLPLPENIWGVVYFFTETGKPDAFISSLRSWRPEGAVKLVCAEYFDVGALRLLAEEKERNSLISALPDFPAGAKAAFYIELSGDDGDALEGALSEHLDLFAASGGKDENTWAESGLSGLARLRGMRHALPDIIGVRTGFPESRVRLETDFSGPLEKSAEYLQMYGDGAAQAGVPCAVYGHVLQNRLHAALIYNSPEQFAAASALVERWAEKVVDDGGLLVSENGIGRLKTAMAERFLPAEIINTREIIKAFFDPGKLLE